jgi:hypothetical protein
MLPDAARLAALAERLAVTPRELLAIAARIASNPEIPLDVAWLDRERMRMRDAHDATAFAAALTLLGYGAFSLDDIDHALRLAWPDAQVPHP